MAHFGSVRWPKEFGTVASLSASAAQPTSTASTSTEGTDKLTYTVENTGHYLVAANLKVTVASDAGTTDTVVAQVAYNDGSAVSAESIGQLGVTPGTGNAKTLNLSVSQSKVIRAVAGTTIVITSVYTVTGVKTVGTTQYDYSIIRIG